MSSSTTPNNANTTLPRRKIGSRACDACKIRKVRCSEVPPCTRCASIGIECTFNKRQATRGPRSLRAKTLAEIRGIQESQQRQQQQQHTTTGFSASTKNDSPPTPAAAGDSAREESGTLLPDHPLVSSGNRTEQQRQQQQQHNRRTPVSSLIVRLCIFRLRLFPVWPILDAEAVIASLLRDPTEIDLETYALANAVCAAIIAQLKLPFEGRTDDNDPATATSMAAECQQAKASLLDHNDVAGSEDVMKNLNMLRISFFQHIYHENMSPGGSKSLLFLREAITIAQIMGLHRKGLYHSLPLEESQMRRRIIWLLFVTERGVAMLHKLPTILVWQPNRFPLLDDTWINSNSNTFNNNNAADKQDEAHILPAFKKLVNLFWVFDQGGAFDIILNADDDADPDTDSQRSNSRLEYLQSRLQEMSWAEELESNEVQQADILVTKSWMQTVLWRASVRRHHHQYRPVGVSSSYSGNDQNTTAVVGVAAAASQHYQQTTIAAGPFRIVNEFLSHISHYSKTALEAHGPTIELKIFEIASALTDALASNLDLLGSSTRSSSSNGPGAAGVDINIRPVEMLVQLQRLLASSRGGNKPLLTMLCARIAEVENGSGGGPSSPPDRGLGDMANVDDNNGDEDDQKDADAIVFGMGYSSGERRLSNPPAAASSSYLDIVRLDYPSQLPAMWPGMRSDSNPNNFNVDPGGNLGITFAQMTNESWNGWALDLSGMSQISML